MFLMRILLFVLVTFISMEVSAQTLVFAQLNGSPVMSTNGWNLAGASAIGDTPGDANTVQDELILTQNVGNSSGAIFFNQPIDLSTCYQWNVQFDFRMYDGTAADGIAFCFLDVPPTGYVSGGGVGIPSTANGIKIVFDTYNNCGGANPEIQIYNGPGYNECIAGITTLNNIGGNLSFLRSNNYNTATISYNYGVVTVSVNGTQYLTGNYNLNFLGYLGFTASTGGSNDRHSIKNVLVYADIATSNAGPDVSICSGDTIAIGAANNPNYTYSWNTAPGLSQTNVSSPSVTLLNTGTTPISQQYTVTTNLVSNPSSCPSYDSVVVTVYPIYLDTLAVSVCSGTTYNFANQSFTSTGTYPVLLQTQFGCDSLVVLDLTVNPAQVTNLQQAICQGSSYLFNGQSLSSAGTYSVVLTSAAGCDSIVNLQLQVNPVLSSSQNISICEGENTGFYGQTLTQSGVYTHTLQTTNGCDSLITLTLTVYPMPAVPILASNSPVLCPDDTLTVNILNAGPNATYSWSGPNQYVYIGTDVILALGFQQLGQYFVTASANGCVSQAASISPQILNVHTFEAFDFPNIITADADGINDALDISAHFQTCQEFTLQILNRWGQLVYEGSEVSPSFKGLDMNANPLEEGVYFYKLVTATDQKSGFFQIVR